MALLFNTGRLLGQKTFCGACAFFLSQGCRHRLSTRGASSLPSLRCGDVSEGGVRHAAEKDLAAAEASLGLSLNERLLHVAQRVVFSLGALVGHVGHQGLAAEGFCNCGLKNVSDENAQRLQRLIPRLVWDFAGSEAKKASPSVAAIPPPSALDYPHDFHPSARLYAYVCSVGPGEGAGVGRSLGKEGLGKEGPEETLAEAGGAGLGSLVRGRRVMDVGSFRGVGSALLVERLGARCVVGVDFSPVAVAAARRRARGLPCASQENLKFVSGDLCCEETVAAAQAALQALARKRNDRSPLGDDTGAFASDCQTEETKFDVAVCVEAASRCAKRAALFQNVSKALRPGGVLLFADRLEELHGTAFPAAPPFTDPKSSASLQCTDSSGEWLLRQRLSPVVELQQRQHLQALRCDLEKSGLRLVFLQDIRAFVGGTQDQFAEILGRSGDFLLRRQLAAVEKQRRVLESYPYLHFLAVKEGRDEDEGLKLETRASRRDEGSASAVHCNYLHADAQAQRQRLRGGLC